MQSLTHRLAGLAVLQPFLSPITLPERLSPPQHRSACAEIEQRQQRRTDFFKGSCNMLEPHERLVFNLRDRYAEEGSGSA